MQGLRCLEQLGAAEDRPALSAVEIARAEGLEPSAITELMDALGAAGFVESVPETPGYYRLTRAPSEIRVAEVWAALSESADRRARANGPTLQHMIDWERKIFAIGEPAQAL